MIAEPAPSAARPPTQSAARPTLQPLSRALEPDAVVVAVTTRHLFGLQQVRASVRLVSGQVRLDAAGGLVGVEAELDTASFASGSRSRDAAVISARLLDATQHPRLVFRSTSASPTTDGGWRVDGTLTARGVTSPTTLSVGPYDGGDDGGDDGASGNTVTATARIDRFAHGITAGRGLASRYLDVLITVTLQH